MFLEELSDLISANNFSKVFGVTCSLYCKLYGARKRAKVFAGLPAAAVQ